MSCTAPESLVPPWLPPGPSEAQTLSLPAAGWGNLRGEGGGGGALAMRVDPASSPWKPHRPGQSQPNEMLAVASSWALGHRALGKLSSHLPTLLNPRSDVLDPVAIPFSMWPCRTGGERAPVRTLPGGGTGWHPHSPLLPLAGKAGPNPVSMATQGSPAPYGCLQRRLRF